jgi:hypothetical protein
MITVVVAVGLLAAGLIVFFLPGADVAALIRDVGLPADVQRMAIDLLEHELFAFGAMAAAPILLILGSLLKGL